MNKAIIYIISIIFLCSFAFAVDIDAGVEFTPSLSNVTYIAPAGGINCTSIEVNTTCLIITGGSWAGSYCQLSSTPVNVSLGNSVLDIVIYDEETKTLITDRNVSIELISDTWANNYTTSTGGVSIGNLSSVDYSLNYEATGYHPRQYFVTLVNNTNSTIDLYLLNDSTDISDRVILTLYDENSDPATNIIIKLQRYYVDTNSYITVSMSRTNFEGQAVLYVELYDVYYKMIYVDGNGNVLKSTDPSPFMTTSPTDSVNLGADLFTSWRNYDDVVYNLTFVNQTGTTFFRYIWSDTNNILRTGCLKVQRHTLEGTYDICYNCSNSSSATLTCPVNVSLTGEYMAVALIDTNTNGSWYVLATEWYAPLAEFDFGAEGVFMTAVWVGTIGLMGVGTVTGSIVLMIVGLLSAWLIGFVTGLNVGLIWYLTALGFIIIFIVRKQ